MTWTLLARNLRHQRRLIVALVFGLAGFEVLLIQIAAAFEQGPGFGEILEMLPPLIRTFVDSQIERFGEISFPAMVAFGFQHPAVMVSSSAMIILAGTTPAGDRESGLLDLLLSRPVPRTSYLTAVVGDLVILALVLPAAVLLGGLVGLKLVDTPPSAIGGSAYVGSALGLTLLLMALGGATLWFAIGAPRRGAAVARVVGLLLPLYVIETFAALSPVLSSIRWLSPFHYFAPIAAATDDGLPVRSLLVLAAMCAIATGSALVRFRRRDV